MKKKHGPLYRAFVSITSPFVLTFVFFWETLGQFLKPIFYVATVPVILGAFVPNSSIPKLLGREGLIPFQLIVFFYFLVRLTSGLRNSEFVRGNSQKFKKECVEAQFVACGKMPK